MELLPVTADYDTISDKMRQYAAQRLIELVETLKPAVAEALDGTSLYDLEPARIQANTALVKLNAALLQQLGALYRVQERPKEQGEQMVPASQVQQLLENLEERMLLEVEAAREEGLRLGRAEAGRREQLSVQAARDKLQLSLAAVQRHS